MNKTLVAVVILIIVALLAIFGYKALYQPQNVVVTTQPSPTPVADDLKQQLMLTEDDGGQADFKSLDQDAQGL